MPQTVDERIVAAKFDASDFEKGVDKTVKKLDELKKSLDLKDATKSVKELAEKTKVSTDSMSKSLDTLTNRFTTFTGMIKQRILGGLADEVAGVFLKMEQSVVGFIKSISSDQVAYGMSKYEQMLTSVRIMMSAGETEGSAYEAIGQLRDYSDQTSYSLSQMTDALSKLRAAGVDLDTATKSVEGIANACANAGINATDAQRAFFNLSQAYSSGVLKYTDYRSLELLNMTTADFKKQILEAAVAAGTLEKTSDGVYKTISKNNKKVTAGKKVTEKNLQDMLRYNFVTSDVMNELFGGKFFFDEAKFREYKRKYNSLDEAVAAAKKDYGETAVNAYLAAREARSFTDVVNTLKDVVSTGWSTSFEHLFGKLEQAKNFFTQLAEGELADVVYKIGEYRNAILGYWNAVDDGSAGGGEVFRQTILNIAEALGTLLKSFLQILPGFDELDNEEGQAQTQLQKLGDRMFMFSMKVRDMSVKIKQAANDFNTLMNSPIMGREGPTRIEVIRKTLSNLLNVFAIAGRVVAIAMNGINKAFYVLAPVIDGISILLNKITEPITNLKDNESFFRGIEDSIDNILTILTPIANVIGEVVVFLGDIAAFFVQMSLDTVTTNITFFSDALGFFMELFTGNSAQKMKDGEGVLDKIRNDFEGIKNACREGLTAVGNFFTALLGDIKKLLGLTEGENAEAGQNGGIFSGVINFFNTNEFVQNAKNWVNQAIVDVGNFIKSIPGRVKQFGANIYQTLRGLFFEEQVVYNGKQWESTTVLTPLGRWLDGIIKSIKDFVIDIPNKIVSAVGTIGSWIDSLFDAWFGGSGNVAASTDKSVIAAMNRKGIAPIVDEKVAGGFETFMQTVTTSIKEWFDDLPNKIQTALKSIGDFATRLWNALDDFLFGKKVAGTKTIRGKDGKMKTVSFTNRYKSGFSKWLDGVIKDVKKFIQNIPTYIAAGIKGAGDIISNIVNALFGGKEGDEADHTTIEERLEKPFLGIDLSGVLNDIKMIGTTILNQIARIFTGSDDIEVNQEWFSTTIANGIEWIRTKAEAALKWVLEFFGSLPTQIANLFKGENAENKNESGPIGKAISGFAETVGGFIAGIPSAVVNFFTDAITEFGKLWDSLYNAIIGNAEEKTVKENDQSVLAMMEKKGIAPEFDVAEQKSKWDEFVESLGKLIATAFEKLPVWISEGINAALIGVQSLFGTITNWFNTVDIETEAKKATEEMSEGTGTIAEGAEAAAEKVESKESPLWTAIKNIGLNIYKLITETIPSFISAAWKWIGTQTSEIWSGLSSIFTGDVPETEIAKAVNEAGTKVKNFITADLPAKISAIWTSVSSFASDLWAGVSSIFTGVIPETERGKAIANIVESVKNFILVNLPAAISKLWNTVFAGNDAGTDKSVLAAMQKKGIEPIVDAVEEETKKADEKLTAEGEKPGFWGFVESLKNSLLEAFEKVGPAILNGLSTAMDWIGKIATFIMDALTGKASVADQIETAYGEKKPELRAALKRIGESLKNFFLETIPKLIGSAIGALTRDAPKWFANLFGAMSGAAEEEAEKAGEKVDEGGGVEKAFQSATGVLGFVKDMLTSLKNWVGENGTILEIIGILIALSMVLSKLGEVFGLADELEAGEGLVKWAAITIAISAIAGIFSFISRLVDSGDATKIGQFNSILDKLANLFEKIIWIVGLLSVGKIADMASDIWGGDDTAAGSSTSFTGKLLNGITGAFSSLMKTISVGVGVDVGAKIASTSIDDFVSNVGESFIGMTSSIDEMIKLVAPFVDDLITLDDKLEKAISAVTKMADLFTTLYTMFGDVYSKATGGTVEREEGTNLWVASGGGGRTHINTYKAPTSIEAFMESLKQRLDVFIQLAEFINYLTNALSKIDNVKDLKRKMEAARAVLLDPNVNFKDFMKDLLNLLKEAVDDSEISPDKFGSTQYMVMRNSGMALALDMLGQALSIFANGISGLDETTVQGFKDTLKVFSELYSSFGDLKVEENSLYKAFLGDNSLSKVGEEIKLFGLHMQSFYDYIKNIPGFTDGEVESTNAKVKSITELARGMAETMKVTVSSGSSLQLLKDLETELPTFADAVAQFFTNLNTAIPTDITVERMEVLHTATDTMSLMMTSLKDLADLLISYSNMDLSSIMDKVFDGMNVNINSARFAALIKVFDDAIGTALDSGDLGEYSDIGKSIAKKMFAGIQAAFTEDPELRPTITPVLNMDQAKKDLQAFFGVDQIGPVDMKKLAITATGINQQTDADRVTWTNLKVELGLISEAIKAGPANAATVADVTTAFAGMKIITDTGVLAAEMTPTIDKLIGERIWQIQRNLTPRDF